MSRVTFQPKLAGETSLITFDFISRLGTTEAISTKTITISVWSGNEVTPSLATSGTASVVNSTQVKQLITGGLVGTIYEINCTILTSLSQTLTLVGYLAVITDLP
jgi:hypothetical protein